MSGFRTPCVCRRCNYHYYIATETGYSVCSHNHVREDRWVVCATGTLHSDLDITCCIEDKAVCMINWVLQLCFCTVSFMLQSKSGVQLGLGFFFCDSLTFAALIRSCVFDLGYNGCCSWMTNVMRIQWQNLMQSFTMSLKMHSSKSFLF